MSSKLFIYGGGGHAKVVLDCLQDAGVAVEAVIDYKYEGDLLGLRRLRDLPSIENMSTIIAIGDNKARKSVSERLEIPFMNAIHSTSTISSHSSVGHGCMILHGTIVQAGSVIGNHVILNTGAQIDHDCFIADFVHVAPGSILCGSVTVGEGTLIGAGSVIKPGIKVGAWVTIGCGAVIVKDIPDYAVVVGNPGRIIKYNNQ
jgi:sugar O-acyltransferase (sialic acid O-acetyltransferase NeuD family)